MTLREHLPTAARAGLFVAWAPIIALMTVAALAMGDVLPTGLQNLLFFWPQAAVPYNTYHGASPQVGARVWPGVWLLYWFGITVVFALATRRVRWTRAFLLAGVAIAVATIALQLLISGTGLYFELDGP